MSNRVDPHEDVRLLLQRVVRGVLEGEDVDPFAVHVEHYLRTDGPDGPLANPWNDYEVVVPPRYIRLVLGPKGTHVDALRMLARMRALKLGWRERVNVHVPGSR